MIENIKILYFDDRDILIWDSLKPGTDDICVSLNGPIPYEWIYSPNISHDTYVKMHYATFKKGYKINYIKTLFPEEFI